ncbi:MAG: hypothetical protein JSW58_12105 [Candidatus Latescibacterota bacterium]|nr:MAG: hypothetical protein JSW58_12105 [Candidatus Latescibacterota bacterium]
MTVPIDKTSLIILIVVVVLTAGIVLVLQTIRPVTTASVTVTCEQINFDTVANGKADYSTSILNTGLWVESVSVSDWHQLLFRVPPAWAAEDSRRFVDNGLVTVVPNSPNSRIEIMSDLEAFSVRDVFIGGRVGVSWRVNGNEHHVTIRSHPESVPTELSVVLSTGDSLQLRLVDCAFLGRGSEMLHETKLGVAEEISFPVSFSRTEAILVSDSGRIQFDARVQAESSEEPLILIRDITVADVGCGVSEYTPDGRLRERNTLVRGGVLFPEYDPDDDYEIQSGEFVGAEPAVGQLAELRVTSGFAEASIVYQVKSLTVGSFDRAQQQLVRSKLDVVKNNQILILIYTTSLAVFVFITKYLLKRKES